MKISKPVKAMRVMCGLVLCLICCIVCRLDAKALTIDYDETKQEIIISGVPETNNDYFYSMYGNLKYKGELVGSFCYGMPGAPYDIPSEQAYIFTYEDIEFTMPGSGTYVITAWIETIECKTGNDLGKSQKTALEFVYNKKDPSTDWGPGLPPTMIEDWELKEINGKDKNLVANEGVGTDHPYTWTINGADVYNLPADGEKVNLQINAMDARFDAYIPGEEIVNIQMDIAHNGDFGFTAKLDYMLGAQYAGKYANLFYIVEPGKYEFVQSCQIDANGMATFHLNHASSYIVVIRDAEYTGEAIVVPTPAPTPMPTPEPTEAPVAEPEDDMNAASDSEKAQTDAGKTQQKGNGDKDGEDTETIGSVQTGGNGVWRIGGIIAITLAAAGAVAYLAIKKKKEADK